MIPKYDVKTALIDGDILVYRAAWACERSIYRVYINNTLMDLGDRPTKTLIKSFIKDNKVDPLTLRITKKIELDPISFALNIVKKTIIRITTNTKTSERVIYLTALNDKTNFRTKVAKTKEYKGNRKQVKPQYYNQIRTYLETMHGSIIVSGQEADDALGVAQSSSPPGQTIICSIDKDLMMIPGWHYDIVKEYVSYISELDGLKAFYKQMLTGDSVDNIPGLRGIGPVTASNLLSQCDSEEALDYVVKQVYKKELGSSMTKEELISRFIEVGKLLWIRRKENEEWLPIWRRSNG